MPQEDLEIYYQSLKRVFDDLEEWEEPSPRLFQRVVDWLLGAAAVFLMLSVVPVIPVFLMLLGDVTSLRVGSINTSDGSFNSFGNLWIGLIFLSGLILLPLIWINNRIDKRFQQPVRPPQSLSEDQITFVRIYQAYKELKVYFVSYVETHLEKAYSAVRSEFRRSGFSFAIRRAVLSEELNGESQSGDLLITPRAGITPSGEAVVYPAQEKTYLFGSLPLQIGAAAQLLNLFSKYGWFELDIGTKSVLSALTSLRSKVLYRLRDRKDLPSVLNVLQNLSAFLYAFLPEHEANMDEDELDQLREQGWEHLQAFVNHSGKLTDYLGPPDESAEAESRRQGFREKALGLYGKSVLVRFAFWLLLLLILTSGLVIIFNQLVAITPDAMATIVISTSVLGAAALAVFLAR